MDSCQRGQAIESSSIEQQASQDISENDLWYQISVNSTSLSSSPCVNEKKFKIKRKYFVPDRVTEKSKNERKHRKRIWRAQQYIK